MRLVVTEFMSLDGVVQAPGGADEDTDGGFAHGGWSNPYFDTEVMGEFIDRNMENADALLYGRRTYEGMAAAWPGRAGDPFADRMNAIKKYVVSNTLSQDKLEWNNTELIPGNELVTRVQALRAQDGRDLVLWGSPTLVRTLFLEGLVDELQLMIEPVILGGGKSIFPNDGTLRAFELVESKPARTGVNICVYRAAQ